MTSSLPGSNVVNFIKYGLKMTFFFLAIMKSKYNNILYIKTMNFNIQNSFQKKKNIYIHYWLVFGQKSIFGKNGILTKSKDV